MTEFKPEDIEVYDVGPDKLERYTVFPYPADRSIFLGMSEGGLAISMWGQVERKHIVNRHLLGERIPFHSLTPDTQRHIKARVTSEY